MSINLYSGLTKTVLIAYLSQTKSLKFLTLSLCFTVN